MEYFSIMKRIFLMLLIITLCAQDLHSTMNTLNKALGLHTHHTDTASEKFIFQNCPHDLGTHTCLRLTYV